MESEDKIKNISQVDLRQRSTVSLDRPETEETFQNGPLAELPSLTNVKNPAVTYSLKLDKGGVDSIENKRKAKGRIRKIAWGELSRVRFIR